MPPSRHLPWWPVVSVATIALLLGLLPTELLVTEEHPLLFELVRELKTAFLVFALLAFTFEGIARRHLIETIDESIANVTEASARKILQSLVGDATSNALEPYLKRASLWRPMATLMISISKTDDNAGVNVRLDFSAKVMNEDDHRTAYKIVVREDANYGGLGPVQITALKWNNQAERCRPEARDGVVQAVQEVFLEGGETGLAHIVWSVPRMKEDHYDFAMWYVTGRLDLIVDHPKDMYVNAEGLGFSEIKLKPGAMGLDRSRWEVERPLLPSQGITVSWRIRDRQPVGELGRPLE